MMGVRITIRNRQMHHQFKTDLVEHLWSKFGRDEDKQLSSKCLFQIILVYCTNIYFYILKKKFYVLNIIF